MTTPDSPSSALELLIVDDDKMISFLHGRVLERFNINPDPSFFANGKEALEYIEAYPNEHTSFLILLDLNMPVMNGWDFLEKCKDLKSSSKIYVIVVTSSVITDDLYRALDYKNVLGFSRKPFTKDSMKALLEFPEIKSLFLDMEYQALENDSW